MSISHSTASHVFTSFYTYVVPTSQVIVNSSGPMPVGSPQILDCMVSTVIGVDSSIVMISWMGPGGGSIMNNSRMTISPTFSSGNTYTSSLWFTYLIEDDEGTYTCNVTILETSVVGLFDLIDFLG